MITDKENNNIQKIKDKKDKQDMFDMFDYGLKDLKELKFHRLMSEISTYIDSNKEVKKLYDELENKLDELDLPFKDRDFISSRIPEAFNIGFYTGISYIFNDVNQIKRLFDSFYPTSGDKNER